jgi:metal-responsive CopG/Arc/MetJ family transcriptional regulator
MVKKVLSVTIDEEVLEIFKKHIKEKCMNSSQLIEKMIKDYLKEERVKK